MSRAAIKDAHVSEATVDDVRRLGALLAVIAATAGEGQRVLIVRALRRLIRVVG